LETAPRVDTTGAGAAAERRTARLRYAAQRIAELAAGAPERSIGVLTRTNRTVAELIFLLKQLDVDVSQEGGNPLTDAALVEVVLSALMLAEHPADLRWAYHVSHSPLSELLELPPWSGEIDPQTLAARVSTAADRVRGKVERAGLSGTLLWLGGALIPIAGAADALRLRQLVGLAHDYQLNPQPRLSAFVELVRQRRVERPQPAQVRVMTTHQAKGLEFDAVVLPDLDGTLVRSARKLVRRSHSPVDPPEALLRYVGAHQWSVLPQAWQTAFGEAAEAAMTEALCLLYVAVTRPRHALRMIIEPATKKKFDLRTPAALITHALAADADPTAPQTTLFEAGNQDWHQN
jgi:ATP-dependent exoDNAse (exonuclease V) beta subunit